MSKHITSRRTALASARHALWMAPVLAAVFINGLASTRAEDDYIPRAQDRPPGPALSPAEAIQQMTVPEGFHVEVFASEPDIVNPVAMAFDEQGRVWITESFEYPRREPGPGRDRVKCLEDTDGDGRCDKVTVFAEGLNIPCGIAVGYGGVWISNAPDILFLQDTDGDGKADKQEVIVTGFGRDDTHELPNAFTWGPDGWLYGLNGVFNPCSVRYGEANPNYKPGQPTWDFTCALYRIHPRTREFQVFCEGTSNPWGVAIDGEGSFFVSACVIDHLWHLTQTGYYIRQGGPYPPFTWPIESIVRHKHQKAAYCGITWFDSPAYPESYREKLYMGNIHGGCVNVDSVERRGSTYFGTGHPDFLTANDAWFMPVAQKTGPDGCLWVLDWYDRYHCYQDANRDPVGVDRGRGRLYRVVHGTKSPDPRLAMDRESTAQLLARLGDPNVFLRETAQRLLAERNPAGLATQLDALIVNAKTPRKQRLHALWTRIALDTQFGEALVKALWNDSDPTFPAWLVRAAGHGRLPQALARQTITNAIAKGNAPREVLLQTAIAARDVHPQLAPTILCEVAAQSADDVLLPKIVWQNIHPLLDDRADDVVAAVRKVLERGESPLLPLVPRLADKLLAQRPLRPAPIAGLLEALSRGPAAAQSAATEIVSVINRRSQTRELQPADQTALQAALKTFLSHQLTASESQDLRFNSALLAATWQDASSLAAMRELVRSPALAESRKLEALNVLINLGDNQLLPTVRDLLAGDNRGSLAFRAQLLASLGRLDEPAVADVVLGAWSTFEPELQPKAAELLTQRLPWTKALLAKLATRELPASLLSPNQVQRLSARGDAELTELLTKIWGTIRTGRDADRELVIAQMRHHLRRSTGDAFAGEKVFKRVCGQCHKIYGEGMEVGPEVTNNGRASFDQLLSNVFDPSLVIGSAYQAVVVTTTDGRSLTGLLVEDSPQKVVLKLQGGKLETIVRDEVDEQVKSSVSLMPEQLERQMTPQEAADLFAFLTLDKHPGDNSARRIPGSTPPSPEETWRPEDFARLVTEIAPGFALTECGQYGLALVENHQGRPGLTLRTHPIDQQTPAKLIGKFNLPADRPAKLEIEASPHPEGNWLLQVYAGQQLIAEEQISRASTKNGWTTITVDLAKFAGEEVELTVAGGTNGDWSWEYGFWGRVEIVTPPAELQQPTAAK